jgi:UDP-galactopyranose mutase
MAMKWDALVVGLGFAGSVCAGRLARAGRRVLAIDRRPHVGGNAYDARDDHGVLIHPYGPHIFHTNSDKVFEHLSLYTSWRPYEHRVRASLEGKLYPIPINRTTLNLLYGLELDEEGAKAYLERVRESRDPIRTSEDVVLNSVGRDLCDKFFRGYTRKQWGLDLSELSAGVAARIPTRTNDDDRYFTDRYNVMPLEGYTAMFERMLDHPNIEVSLETEFASVRGRVEVAHVVYTGPIDDYYGNRFGKLPYRSLRFRHEHFGKIPQLQEVAVYNYPGPESPYTRVTEFKHLTGQAHAGTSIVRESSAADGDPYYPIPRPQNEALYGLYKALAEAESNVTFVGRLAQYRYFNMDQVVAAALAAADRILQSPSGPR